MTIDEAERNKEALSAFHKALIGDDFAAAFALMQNMFDPALVVFEPDSLPFGGTYHGLDSFLSLMPSVGQYIDAKRIKLENLVADGANVVARWRYPFRLSAEDDFVEVEVNEWRVFRVGKIVEAN